MRLSCLVIYRFTSGYFHKQNAIPVSAAFVVTSTQPFALAPPEKTRTNYPSFKPCGLTSKPDGTLVNVVENNFLI